MNGELVFSLWLATVVAGVVHFAKRAEKERSALAVSWLPALLLAPFMLLAQLAVLEIRVGADLLAFAAAPGIIGSVIAPLTWLETFRRRRVIYSWFSVACATGAWIMGILAVAWWLGRI